MRAMLPMSLCLKAGFLLLLIFKSLPRTQRHLGKFVFFPTPGLKSWTWALLYSFLSLSSPLMSSHWVFSVLAFKYLLNYFLLFIPTATTQVWIFIFYPKNGNSLIDFPFSSIFHVAVKVIVLKNKSVVSYFFITSFSDSPLPRIKCKLLSLSVHSHCYLIISYSGNVGYISYTSAIRA